MKVEERPARSFLAKEANLSAVRIAVRGLINSSMIAKERAKKDVIKIRPSMSAGIVVVNIVVAVVVVMTSAQNSCSFPPYKIRITIVCAWCV